MPDFHHGLLGFRPDKVVTFEVLPDEQHPARRQNEEFFRSLLERLSGVAGVRAAAAASLRPFRFGSIGSDVGVLREGERASAATPGPDFNFEVITPNYFKVMGIEMVGGRPFGDFDRANTQPVAILSMSAAEQLWPGEDALGRRIRLGGSDDEGNTPEPLKTVVGVVKDVRYRELTKARSDVYVPSLQSTEPANNVVIQSDGDPHEAVNRLRTTLRSMEPTAAISNSATLSDVVAGIRSPWRFNMLLFLTLSLTATLLALVGLYGLFAHFVAMRSRDLAIRSAIGATPRELFLVVIRRALSITALGLGFGLAIFAATSRLLGPLLFGVGPLDVLTFGSVTVISILAVFFAALLPALAASRTPAQLLLRAE